MKKWFRIETAVAACSIAAILAFLYVVTGRLFFQYDLEWTEGGLLLAAERLASGQSLYVRPTLDYVPFAYPPVFLSIVAFWIPIVGKGFHVARAVSVFYLLVAAACLWIGLRGRRGLARLAALGLFFAAFGATGGIYDLALPDSTALGLFAVAYLLCGGGARPSLVRGMVAGLFGFLSAMTYQPYLFYAAGLFAILLLSHRPSGVAALATLGALTAAAAAWGLSQQGWPLVYISTIPFKAWLYSDKPLLEGLRELVQNFAPLLLIAFWGVARDRKEEGAPFTRRYGTGLFLGMVVLGSIVHFSEPEAGSRGFVLIAWLLALLAGRELDAALGPEPEGASVKPRPSRQGILVVLGLGFLALLYRPSSQLPDSIDLWVGNSMLSKLQLFEGRVLIPQHPYTLVLAGKQPNFHLGALEMYQKAGLQLPKDFFLPIARQEFSFAVTDGKIAIQELGNAYMLHQSIDIPGNALLEKTGRKTRPSQILVPQPKK